MQPVKHSDIMNDEFKTEFSSPERTSKIESISSCSGEQQSNFPDNETGGINQLKARYEKPQVSNKSAQGEDKDTLKPKVSKIPTASNQDKDKVENMPKKEGDIKAEEKVVKGKMSTTKKVIIFSASAIALGTIAYFIFKK